MVHVIVGTGFPIEVQEMSMFPFSETVIVPLVVEVVLGGTEYK